LFPVTGGLELKLVEAKKIVVEGDIPVFFARAGGNSALEVCRGILPPNTWLIALGNQAQPCTYMHN
jgi:hypothetical protein